MYHWHILGRCYQTSVVNINVVIGKECKDGYSSRILELSEERSGQCVKTSFSLRRIRCQRLCSKKSKILVSKCKSNQRTIKRLKEVKESNKCVWKPLSSKSVKCTNPCPLPKERKSRCILGKQTVTKVTFKEVGDECRYTVVKINTTSCQSECVFLFVWI